MLHLIDKSAVKQAKYHPQAADVVQRLIDERQLAVCQIVALEVLYSARSATDYRTLRGGLDSLVWLPVANSVMNGALAIQGELAERGQHRRAIPDLIVAATALEHEATVLHYDHDYDIIAAVTGQPVRWIIPRGSGH